MGSSSKNSRQIWLPILILVAIIFTASWLFGGNEVVSSFLGDDQDLDVPAFSPLTAITTGTPTAGNQQTQSALLSTAVEIDNSSSTSASLTTDVAAEFTPDSEPIKNCTFTIHFWKVYSGAWETNHIIFGERAYTKVQAISILNIEDPSLATTRLMQQYITALLNTLKGADPTEIERTMERALEWLIVHPPEIGLSQSESLAGETLAGTLEDFNNGVTGPGHCEHEPFTPTPGATPTPLNWTPPATATFTPAPFTPSGSETPASTTKPGGGSKPTDPPTTQPTNPPPSQPTNTSKPPTPRPTPTFAPPPPTDPPPPTQPPPPTPVPPTDPPPPTEPPPTDPPPPTQPPPTPAP